MKKIQEYLNDKGFALKVDGVIGPKTKSSLMMYIRGQFYKKGYKLPSKGLVYFRTDNRLTNTYDDFVALIKDTEVHLIAPCSTTAGTYWVQNPITHGGITGTAIAIEQQVQGSHTFVTAKNWKTLWLQMPYFKQTKPIQIFRDGNKDDVLNTGTTQKGLFGINLHKGGLSSFVDRWSAGCLVVPQKHWELIIPHFYNGEQIDFNLIS